MGNKTDSYNASKINSVIGKGTEFEGTIRTSETLRIEGFVKGNIFSEGTLIVGKGGKVDGKIEAVNLLVGGEVYGDFFASNRVEANATGHIYGNIHTKSLIVDEAAIFQGTCEMLGRDEASKVPAPVPQDMSPKSEEQEKTEPSDEGSRSAEPAGEY